jgi:hypothetical protein
MTLNKQVPSWILIGAAAVWLAMHLFGLARLPLANCAEV